jgi:hypothetical protein
MSIQHDHHNVGKSIPVRKVIIQRIEDELDIRERTGRLEQFGQRGQRCLLHQLADRSPRTIVNWNISAYLFTRNILLQLCPDIVDPLDPLVGDLPLVSILKVPLDLRVLEPREREKRKWWIGSDR